MCIYEGSVGNFEGKRNGHLCVDLLSFSVVNWRSVYLFEVLVRRLDLFYFFKKPSAPDSLKFFILGSKLQMDLKGI